ncbi:MAG: DUF11 domain-containing protein [Acidobacteriota bacterium]|nr:DUF11 domain-containing protein [Acidobacteriota bacterium]
MLLKSTRTIRSLVFCAVLGALFLLTSLPAAAEGSRELMDFEEAQGGDARYAMRNADSIVNARPGWVIFEVYAQAGETLHVGSNTTHTGNGNIYVWEPGTPVISDTFPSALFASAALDCVAQAGGDTNVGLIDTRAKEQAGPEVTPGDGGYASCQLAAATSGLYSVMFRAVVDSGSNPSNMSISDPNIGTQNTTGVHAWDVTVRDSGGTDQPGRLMSRWLALYETAGGGPDQQIFVLTRDGHRYRAIFDELNGISWFMFSNNKGVQDRATGEPTYLSWASSQANDPMDPQFIHPVYADDTAEDVTNRIFVNPPDPTTITGASGLGEILGYQAGPGFLPAPTNLQFDGTASGGGTAMAPNGFTDSVFTFGSDPSLNGVRYSLTIDADRNGSYGDTIDRRLSGVFDSTGNTLSYDGTDGLGDPLDFDQIYTARIQGTGAEVHFPLTDVENFGNGLTIERLTNPGAGDVFRAAYDDFNGSALTNTMPVSLPGGGDSSVTGFHSWSANSGNRDTIDTWTFTAVTGPAVTQFAVGSPAGGVPPAFSKTFSPNPVAALEVTTLTFFIDNLANPVAANNLDFSDTFPAGMTVADPANAATDCTGGTLTAAPGAGSMSYTGGSIAANSLCSVSVDVTSDTQGLSANVSGELTSDLGSSGTATDTLEVLAPLPVADLATVKQASAANVESGGTLTYTITVTNNSATVTVPDVVVIDDLPLEVTLLGSSGCAEDPLGAPICTLGSLAPGASTFYTLEVQVDAADGASLVNTAIATSEQTNDDDPTNDISVAEVTVGLVAIPTLDVVGFSMLALLLLTAALRRLRRI